MAMTGETGPKTHQKRETSWNTPVWQKEKWKNNIQQLLTTIKTGGFYIIVTYFLHVFAGFLQFSKVFIAFLCDPLIVTERSQQRFSRAWGSAQQIARGGEGGGVFFRYLERGIPFAKDGMIKHPFFEALFLWLWMVCWDALAFFSFFEGFFGIYCTILWDSTHF